MDSFLFTSESVTEGHPDKICDQISDAVLDAVLKDDAYGRVACETFVTTGLVIIGGEITTSSIIDYQEIARSVLKKIGYCSPEYGIDYNSCGVLTSVKQQSKDIKRGVDREGAGDQGMMFGFAVRDTKELMPAPIALAHKLTKKLSDVRKKKILPFLRPDGKSQVSVVYENGVPKHVQTVVIAAQHNPDINNKNLREAIVEEVIKKVIPSSMLKSGNAKFHINPTGRFVTGGPEGDAGLTGRKIIVDTYGGFGRHGGGAYSGKDPTKVDRSASYAARWVAKNIVAAGLAERCEVQLAYAIGVAHPVSIFVETRGTGKISDDKIVSLVKKHFDLRPQAIIDSLKLRRPIYENSASYGHFGREDSDFLWEKTNKASLLKSKK